MKTDPGALSRRRFLERAGAVAGAVALGACGGDDAEASPGPDGSTANPKSAAVAIVGDLDVGAAVARAVELAGGLDAILPGQVVFIKPNAVSDRAIGTPGIRTSPEVLAAVVRLVKLKQPGRIIVGDRSARAFPDTARVFEVSGLGEAALAAGADEVFAAPSPTDDPDEWLLMQPPRYEESWAGAGGILVMRRIVEADHVINLPACKDHRYALFTLSLKNFIGAIGDASRDPLHFGDSIVQNFSPIGRDIAILNQPFSPLVNVLDATTALVNGGPQGDGPDAVRVAPGLILASKDRVALDAAGAALLKLELERTAVPQPDAAHSVLRQTPVWRLPQIQHAVERGLGVASADAVTLHFEGVSEAAALETIYRT